MQISPRKYRALEDPGFRVSPGFSGFPGFRLYLARAVRGKCDELALALTAGYVKGQSQTRVLQEGSEGKIYVPGDGKVCVDEGDPFSWTEEIGGPWAIDAGDTINIKSQLWELDGKNFLTEVLSHFTGISSKNDDHLGSQNVTSQKPVAKPAVFLT